MATQLHVPAGLAAHAEPGDLALVGEIAALMDVEQLWDSLDLALRRLREHSGADVAELFLGDPRGQEAFLVSHVGADLEAFCLRDRFRAGDGFPGISLRTGVPVVTTKLPDDPDFLRTRVKALHYQTAICVPILQNSAVGGCLLLAWKGRCEDVERAVGLTALATRPIGAALEVVRCHIRVRELERRSAGDAGDLARAHRGPALADAALEWSDATRRSGALTFSVRSADGIAGEARARDHADCPACTTGHIQVRGGRAGWPGTCLRSGCAARARYCIPLGDAGRVWGIATVTFRKRVPVPLTRHLPVALWMTEDLAPAGHGTSACVAERIAPAARLVIRCLGGFAVTVDGRPLKGPDLARTKARELLALLVAAGGQLRSGVQLAAALWPEATPAQARNRFHVTLSALRRAVEPAGGGRWVHVRRVGCSYYLDSGSAVAVDLWRYRELMRQAGSASGAWPAEVARQRLEEAADLYEGDPFDGQFSATWPDGLVRWCRGAALHALDLLADLQMGAGDPEAAVATLRRAETLDPLRPPERRRRVELLAATAGHTVHAASAGRAANPRATLRTSPTNAISQVASAT